jgi:small conductance mechanosensitive channel
VFTRRGLDPTLGKFFGNLLRWFILLGVLLGCLGAFGIETTSFAALLASAGLAIGLAFQGTLSNFAAGVMLLVFRPFKVGDVVSAAGQTGTIVEIELFTTEMTGFDNRRIIIPNTKIFGDIIMNLSYHPTRRVDVTVGVAYDADIDETREVLLETMRGIETVLDDPPPEAFLKELGDSAVVWQLRMWSKSDDYWAVYQEGTRAAKMKLDAAKIGIPFPQMDVHLDKSA